MPSTRLCLARSIVCRNRIIGSGSYRDDRRPDPSAPVATSENDRAGHVDDGPAEGDDEHPSGENLRWIAKAIGRLDEDPDRDRDESDAIDERGENLCTFETEAALRRRRPPGEPDREEREGDRPRVGEHVTCVGEKSEAAGQQAADRFGRRVGVGQSERQPKRARVAPPRTVSAIVAGAHPPEP